MKPSKPYMIRHFHVNAYLPIQVKDVLNRVLSLKGVSFTTWLNSCIERDIAERLPESQGGVKKIIPPEVAIAAREVLEQQGDTLYKIDEKTSDPKIKHERLQEAGRYYDFACFFGTVEGETFHRKHLLDSGQRQPRQRRKSADSPAAESSSKT